MHSSKSAAEVIWVAFFEARLEPLSLSDGRWGQVRIWDAALARAQINDEARHAHCTPLLAFWGFNGRAGDTTMDAGPYRQDLDLSGGYEAKWNDYHEVTWAQQGALSRLSLPELSPTFLLDLSDPNSALESCVEH